MAHFEGIKNSIQYIEEHLFENLSLTKLSHIAHLSEFYFLRLFKSIVGTSPMDYIQKRRLSSGLYEWTRNNNNESLLHKSLEMGFSSQSAMSRAFKRSFGMTPSNYSKQYHNGHQEEIFPPYNFWMCETMDFSNVYSTEFHEVELNDMILIGDQRSSTLKNGQNFVDVYALINELFPFWKDLKHIITDGPYDVGVAFNSKVDRFDPDQVTFDYFRGYHVTKIDSIPKNLKIKKVSGGRFLTIKTSSQEAEYHKTINYIIHHLLFSKNLLINDLSVVLLEKMRYDVKLPDDEFEMDIFIPIKYQ